MIENELESNAVEEASEIVLEEVSTETEVNTEETVPTLDYLSPEIFQGVKVYNIEDKSQDVKKENPKNNE